MAVVAETLRLDEVKEQESPSGTLAAVIDFPEIKLKNKVPRIIPL